MSAQAHAPGSVVDGQLTEGERFGLGPVAERGLDAGHELGGGERLDDVVGRAALERPGDGLVAPVGGDEDDGEFVQLGHPPHQFDAVGSRQHQVEEHEAGPLGADDAGEPSGSPVTSGS